MVGGSPDSGSFLGIPHNLVCFILGVIPLPLGIRLQMLKLVDLLANGLLCSLLSILDRVFLHLGRDLHISTATITLHSLVHHVLLHHVLLVHHVLAHHGLLHRMVAVMSSSMTSMVSTTVASSGMAKPSAGMSSMITTLVTS